MASPQVQGWVVPKIQSAVCSLPFIQSSPMIKGLLEHPAGPFTSELNLLSYMVVIVFLTRNRSFQIIIPLVHFWAPTTKWLISAANIIDLHRPVEKMSLPQQAAVGSTGVIWSYYSLKITPVNYNLLLVNAVMACTSAWHLGRMIKHEMDKQPKK